MGLPLPLPNSAYSITVKLYNAGGYGGSGTVSYTTGDFTPPAAGPTNLQLTSISATEVDVSWSGPAWPNVSLQVSTDPFGIKTDSGATITGSGNTATITGLQPGTPVWLQLGSSGSSRTELPGPVAVTTLASAVPAPTALEPDGSEIGPDGLPQAADLLFSRSGDLNQSVDLPITLTGTAPGSAYKLVDGYTGQIITGSVNFPAGFSNKVIEVIPINDGTPQWMRTVTATEGSAADTQTDSTPATVAIGGGNFGLTVGNGSDNQIFQASSDGTQHLVPVALNLPTTIVPGSTVTLVIDSLVPIDVWATDTPQPGDTPLNASGNTITWTESLNPPIVVPAIIFIGVKDGSTQLNPIAMKLIPEDAPPPTNPPPGHHYPPPPPPPPPSRKREDAMDLRIISHNDPNGDVPDGSDVTGQSRKWLIGQVADLEAQIVGPLGIGAGPIYQWTVTGNQQPLYGYDEGNYYRHAIPLAPFNDFLNGTSERDVHFFWTSTSAPPPGFDANVVSVSALSSGFGTLSAQTTLNTYSPPVSSVAGQYAPGFNAGATAVGLFSPPTSSDPQGLSGVFISAAVKDPAGFNQGAWAYLQKIMPSEHYTTDTGIGHHNDSSRPIGKNYYQLDTLIDPGTEDGVQVSPAVVTYPNYPWQSLADKYTSADGTAWPTGTTTHMFGDAPLLGLNKRNEASIDDAFRTWIMYLPTSGAASEPSQWVPVMSVDWAVKVQAVKNANGVWTLAATPTPAAYKALTLQRSTEVPQWDNWADVKTDTWPTP